MSNIRNISEECKTCKDNKWSIAMCWDCCGIPISIIEDIEEKRNNGQEVTKNDNNSKY